MNNKFVFIRSSLALSIAFASFTVSAAGFQLNGQSATGLGRAFAGTLSLLTTQPLFRATLLPWLYLIALK